MSDTAVCDYYQAWTLDLACGQHLNVHLHLELAAGWPRSERWCLLGTEDVRVLRPWPVDKGRLATAHRKPRTFSVTLL